MSPEAEAEVEAAPEEWGPEGPPRLSLTSFEQEMEVA
jgi:hypothetical protein